MKNQKQHKTCHWCHTKTLFMSKMVILHKKEKPILTFKESQDDQPEALLLVHSS